MSIPHMRSSLLTPKHIRFYRGECGYCHAFYIYVTKPNDAQLTQQILEDAANEMNCLFSETIEDVTFCPECNLSIDPETIDHMRRDVPMFTVISDTLVKVDYANDSATLADVAGKVQIHHIDKMSVKFYRGSCYSCSEEFIYPESKELGDIKIPQRIINRLETNMGARWGSKAEHTAMKGKIWRCNNCRTLFFPSNKHCREQWGSLVPEYTLLDDGKLYEVKPHEETKKNHPKQARRSSYASSSSSYSWGDYGDDYGYSSYSGYKYTPEPTMQEKLDAISDLIAASKDKRPRPSTAGVS